MFRLAYLSHAREPFGIADLSEVLSTARRRNPSEDLTGMLIFHQGVFLQFLEGSESFVRRCFERIEKDPRHHSVRILSETKAQSRAFSNWSMGYIAPDDMPLHLRESVRALRDVAERVQEAPSIGLTQGKQDVADLIKRFIERAEPALLD